MINYFNDELISIMRTHRALRVPEARFVIASEGVSLYSCNELQREGRSDESGDEPSKNGNASLMPDYACIRDSTTHE